MKLLHWGSGIYIDILVTVDHKSLVALLFYNLVTKYLAIVDLVGLINIFNTRHHRANNNVGVL